MSVTGLGMDKVSFAQEDAESVEVAVRRMSKAVARAAIAQSKLSQGFASGHARITSAGLGGRVVLDAERPLHPRDIVPCTELPADSMIDADRLEAHRLV